MHTEKYTVIEICALTERRYTLLIHGRQAVEKKDKVSKAQSVQTSNH